MRILLGLAAMLAGTFTTMAPVTQASCSYNIGTCASADCYINVGDCTDGGACHINVGTCTSGGHCTVTVGTCSDGRSDLIAL